MPSEDILLATSDFAKGMQADINHCVTRGKLNNVSFGQKLDPIAKRIFRKQNPLELVFEDISTFDAQNPIVGSLLRELDIEKKGLVGEVIKKVPRSGIDLDIQKRLETLTITIPMGCLYLNHLHRHLITFFHHHPCNCHRRLIYFKQTFKRLHHHYRHPLYCHC